MIPCPKCFGLLTDEVVISEDGPDYIQIGQWWRCINCGNLGTEATMAIKWTEERRKKFQNSMAKRFGREAPYPEEDEKEEVQEQKPKRPRLNLQQEVDNGKAEEPLVRVTARAVPESAEFKIRPDCDAFMAFAASWAEHYRLLVLVAITLESEQDITSQLSIKLAKHCK